ncbi:MAG: hypothetical protein WBF33_13825 [Candidatus Nitrosopolaris sp.]|jgi:hypothetical protein
MLQKKSCRACGTNMTTTAVCGVCKEDVSWGCSRCAKMEAETHVHTYERAGYKEEISATANSC